MAATITPSHPLAPAMRQTRLASLMLQASNPDAQARTPLSIVEWFGAMQAQDLASGLWSFGVRMPGATQSDVLAAVERGEILRTWPMRGTVHFVPSRDASWMVRILGERPLAGAVKRRQWLGLSDQDAYRAGDVLAEALAGGIALTRAECVDELLTAGIDSAAKHAYHLLWFTSQRGITCIGPNRGSEQTFVLLDDFVPNPHDPDREEALMIMAERYFRSHGPATSKDFLGWLGTPAADARAGIAGCGRSLTETNVDGIKYLEWVGNQPSSGTLGESGDASLPTNSALDFIPEVQVLPGFDEFILGFKDRGLVLTEENWPALVPGNNGIFRSTLIHQGQVLGTWTRTIKSTRVEIRPVPFAPLSESLIRKFASAFEAYARYLGLTPVLKWDPAA